MQACLRSSLSNAESEDGDKGFIWFGNFWWKYSHCKMSVIQLVLKKSTSFPPRNRPLLRGGSGWKRDGSGWGSKLPSGPLSGLAWFEWETWCLHVSQVTCLPNCLVISCAVLERVGPFHPSTSKPMSSGLTWTVQDKSSKLNLPWPVETICLISSLPSFPKTFCYRTSNSSYIK